MKPCLKREQKLYDALKEIAKDYQSVESMRRYSEKDLGLCWEECLEYAYENMKNRARNAIRGMRRPKIEEPTTNP